jgi:hypothetical protein
MKKANSLLVRRQPSGVSRHAFEGVISRQSSVITPLVVIAGIREHGLQVEVR